MSAPSGLPFSILPTDHVFADSPYEGTAECVCSRCGALIPEDTIALRAFIDEGRGGEYRYCDYCQENMGFWSHEHIPVIVHRTGGPAAEELNACGECGQRIVKVAGKWKLMPPDGYFKRLIVERLDCTDGCQEVKLSCGHVIIRIIPTKDEAIDCSECVNEYIRGAIKSATRSGRGLERNA